MKKRMLSILLALCLLLSLAPALGGTVKADDTALSGKAESILSPSAPAAFVEGDAADPYMKGKGQPFLLSEQDEALFYLQYDSITRGVANQEVGDTFQKGNVSNKMCDAQPLSMDSYATNVNNTQSPVTKENSPTGMAFVTAVSFDPTGSGRKDHVAYVGYNVDSKRIETWVTDTAKDLCSTPVPLSGVITDAWIHLTQYNYHAFFSITAGDYDGDHKDTYIVYCPGTNTIDPQLYEFSLEGTSYQQRGKLSVLNENLTGADANGGKAASTPSGFEDGYGQYVFMPTMSLATGDFDADGKDELATSSGSYMRMPGDIFAASRLTVLDQNPDTKAFSRTDPMDLRDLLTDSDGTSTWRILYTGALAAGDLNADGKDELIVAGYTGVATCKNISEWSNIYGRDKNNYAVTTLSCESGTYVRTDLQTVQMNNFTKNHTGHASNPTWPLAAVACVAINGASSAEEVFLSGTLYTWDSGTLTAVFLPDYFSKSYDKVDDMTGVKDHWVESVTVGNFDGNDAGRQQVLFTTCTINNDEKYIYKVGIVGGDKYKDEMQLDESTNKYNLVSYGQVSSYYSSDIQSDTKDLYRTDGKHNSWWDDTTDIPSQILNCVPVAVDRDQDGVIAKYAGNGWVYSDPSVLAVLQAAPYFSELGSYSDFGGRTSYKVTTSYTYGKTSQDNVSFGFGFAGETVAGPVQISVEAGYTLNWSKTYTNELKTSYSTSFEAGPYDQVIVQRTPALVYSYEIQNADGSYNDSNVFQFTVPLEPTYTKLSVDEYNSFVDEYKAWYEHYVPQNKQDESVLLQKIDQNNPLLPSNNEGNPAAYWNKWSDKTIKRTTADGTTYDVTYKAQSLSKGNYTLDYSAGSTTSEWELESSTSKSITMNHGFHFSLTLQGGVNLPGGLAQSMVGGYVNLDYSHGTGHYTTNTKAAEASGTVGDIDAKKLESKGIPESVIKSYAFQWNFGMWEGDLGGTCLGNGIRDANKNSLFDGIVPVFGYAVSSVTMPPVPVTDLSAIMYDDSTATLSWTVPSASGNRPISGYNVYRLLDDGTYQKLNGSAPVTETSYTVDGIFTESDKDYRFVVTSVYDNGTKSFDSLWSNVATVTTPKQYYTLTMTGQVSASAGYQGISISSGDTCPQDTLIYVKAKALDGYALIGYQVGNGTKVTFAPCAEKSFSFRFPAADTTVAFTTQQVRSEIDFKSNNSTMGSVTATVDGTPLTGSGIVSDSITIQAQANPGYVVHSWTIDDGSSTSTVFDDGSGILNFNPVKPGYTITANFVPEDSPEVLATVTVDATENGSIEIKDSLGNALIPDSNNQISVRKDSVLSFRAIPDPTYSLKSWNGSLSGKVNPMTVEVKGDMNVGADFSAPIRYKLTFTSPDGGIITALSGSSAVTSGEDLPAGSSVTLRITKAPGYALDSWLVNGEAAKGGETLNLTLNKSTHVTAALKLGFQITASAGAGGSISPFGASAVTAGGSAVYQITPSSGYEIADVQVDGSSVGALYSYTFTNVNEEHTIHADFRQTNAGGSGNAGGTGSTNTYTLSFAPNGGTTIASVSALEGTIIGLSGYRPVRSGWDFSGWYADAALTRPVATVILTADTTVYAKWTESVAAGQSFLDVPDSAYYADAVRWAAEEGIATGVSASEFDPDGVCTRAQAVTFLWRAAGSPAPGTSRMPFTDVSVGSYYYDAVLWAVGQGIAKGTSRTTFSPDLKCSRAQIVTFLWRADGAPGTTAANPFTDVKNSAYYAKAVLWAVAGEITNGTGLNRFSPDNSCTRAQIVTFIYRDRNR